MKINKVSLLALLAVGGLTTFGTVAQAQDASTPSTNAPAGPGGSAGGMGGGAARLNKMDEKLGLTGDTKTQFDAIYKDQMEQMKALRSDESLTPEDRKAKTKEIREATDTKVKALLTADQYTEYQAMNKKQHKPKGGNNGGSTNAPSATPPPAPQN